MPDKYHNKYRIPSARLQSWDYGSNAAYFITICTKNREHYFGEMVDDTMELSTIGLQVEQEWIKTPALRPDMNLELGNFVVMPNHFHAILIIGENKYNTDGITTTTNQFGPQSKNLASIIRGFKSAVTTYAKINCIFNFAWQPRFHDHIIRNADSFETIQNYIANNHLNWKDDKFYSE